MLRNCSILDILFTLIAAVALTGCGAAKKKAPAVQAQQRPQSTPVNPADEGALDLNGTLDRTALSPWQGTDVPSTGNGTPDQYAPQPAPYYPSSPVLNGPVGKAYRSDTFRCVSTRGEQFQGENANWIPLTADKGGKEAVFVPTSATAEVLTDFMMTVGVRMGAYLMMEITSVTGRRIRWEQAYLGHQGQIGVASLLSNHKFVRGLTPGVPHVVRAYLYVITSDDGACSGVSYDRHISIGQPELTIRMN